MAVSKVWEARGLPSGAPGTQRMTSVRKEELDMEPGELGDRVSTRPRPSTGMLKVICFQGWGN